AAKLAVGYTLDEIANDITRETPACFEPTIDYVVVKVPRFTFDKFPQTKDTLGPQMKSVGEAMAIGRTFKEALQKAIRSLEIGSYGFEEKVQSAKCKVQSLESRVQSPESGVPSPESGVWSPEGELAIIQERLRTPNAERLWYVAEALRLGMSVEELYQITKIDPWFLENIAQIMQFEEKVRTLDFGLWTLDLLSEAKRMGFSDVRLAKL